MIDRSAARSGPGGIQWIGLRSIAGTGARAGSRNRPARPVVGGQAGVEVFAPHPGTAEGSVDAAPGDPVKVASDGLAEARARHFDVVIVDTAGRLGIDDELMAQAASIREAVVPRPTRS